MSDINPILVKLKWFTFELANYAKCLSIETSHIGSIKEELNIHLQENDLKYYTHITAPAYGEMNGTIMEQDCFLVIKTVEPIAAAEISELRYFTLTEYLSQSQTAPGAVKILEILKEDNLVD